MSIGSFSVTPFPPDEDQVYFLPVEVSHLVTVLSLEDLNSKDSTSYALT